MGPLQKYQETVISLLLKVHILYRPISWRLQGQRGSSEKRKNKTGLYFKRTYLPLNKSGCEKIQVFA